MTARILVVDDIEANVRLLEAKLQAEYYDVLSASDGETALAIAAAEKPDLVLLDIMMPGMDGFEVCRRLKDDPSTRHIPVVLVTALDGRTDRITGLEAGADEFLTKPIDDVLLFARVKSLTRLKLVIDELRQREASGRRIGVIAGAASRLGRRRRAHPGGRRSRAPGAAHLGGIGGRAPAGRRERAREGAADRPRSGRPRHRQCHGARLRRPAFRRPDPLRRGDASPADPRHHRSGRPHATGEGAGDRLQRRADAADRPAGAVGAGEEPGARQALHRLPAQQPRSCRWSWR